MANKYWFKRKTYGYGWTPITWQGWLLMLIYVLIITISAALYSQNNTALFVAVVCAATVVVTIVCFKKGPKPRWQWGKNEDRN